MLKTLKKKDNSVISESIEEIEKMSEILEWLVELSDIQANKQGVQVLVSDEIQKCIKVFKSKFSEKDLEIEIKNTHEQHINVYPPYFYIFITNILWNAIKYSKKWGKIQIIIKKNSFSIIDEGIWIEEGKIEKIFDRFFKAHSSNSYEWSGIWLSLVKKIADIYKWKIDIESGEEKGTKVHTHF
jgi:signal transduction histidine kinase